MMLCLQLLQMTLTVSQVMENRFNSMFEVFCSFLKKLASYFSLLLHQEHKVDRTGLCKNSHVHFESLFTYPPFLKPYPAVKDEQKTVELNIGS